MKRIKIKHPAFSDIAWYRKFVGQDFELITEDADNYWVKTGDKIGSIEKCDGEVVEEEIITHPLLKDLLVHQKNEALASSTIYGPGLHNQNVVENKNKIMDTSAHDIIGTYCKKCGMPFCICKTEFSKEKPTKISEGKLFWEMNWDYLEGVAKRMQANKGNKYEKFAWKKGVDIDEINQAILRHTVEIMKGNTTDDTEYGHYEALCCNAMLAVHELKKKEK